MMKHMTIQEDAVRYVPAQNINKCKIICYVCLYTTVILILFYASLLLIFYLNNTNILTQSNLQRNMDRGVNMKMYSTGFYTIKPIDYNYSKNVIIELWGAGGGGCTCVIDDGFNTKYNFGGGSGGYIKASIETNQSTINIIVGEGMNGVETSNICSLINNPNGYTTLKIDNKVLFSAGGGGACGNVSQFFWTNEGKNIINPSSKNVLSLNGKTGLGGGIGYGANGGDAPYGGKGGNGGVLYRSQKIYAQNGDVPAGGGGGGGGLNNIIPSANGANGGFIIYY